MLELKNVSREYKGKKVLDGFSVEIGPGQILGLIGSNGAGKSTCVKMIATLSKPDEGDILYNGVSIVKKPEAIRQNLGYVPQDIALYDTLTGRDNLKFWVDCYHVPYENRAEAIAKACALVGLDDETISKKVSECSGGMKRRLNIAVALLADPDVVVLDEPTAGVDLKSAELILSAISELGEKGKTVIYVGHQLEEVEKIATDICILNEGKCRVCGKKEELLGKSRSLRQLYEEACSGEI